MALGLVILVGLLAEAVNGVPLSPEKPFIIGGEDAPEAYAPYMAALIFGEQVQNIVCGGSIIGRTLVLTAAHCVEAMIMENSELLPSFYILVGSNNWTSGGTIANVQNYIMHPQWDSKNIKNDIGVLILTKKLELNERVTIIPLDFNFVDDSETVFVTGWGVTAPKDDGYIVNLAPIPYDLQLLYMKTLDHKRCEEQMTSVAGHIAPAIQQDIEICTFHSYNHGMCRGDSGSPLVNAGTRKQIGIVSWGINCADGAPDVYVRISGFKHFLCRILKTYKD